MTIHTPQGLKAIVDEVAERYPVDIFPDPVPGCSTDCYSAAGARLACRSILSELERTAKLEPEHGEPIFNQEQLRRSIMCRIPAGELEDLKAERDALKVKLDASIREKKDGHLWPSTIVWSSETILPSGEPARMAGVPDWVIEEIKNAERERIIALLAEMGYLSYEVRSAIEIQGEKK